MRTQHGDSDMLCRVRVLNDEILSVLWRPLALRLPDATFWTPLADIIREWIFGVDARVWLKEEILRRPTADGGFGLLDPRTQCVSLLAVHTCQVLLNGADLAGMLVSVLSAFVEEFQAPVAFLLTRHGDFWRRVKNKASHDYLRSVLQMLDQLHLDVPEGIPWERLTPEQIAAMP